MFSLTREEDPVPDAIARRAFLIGSGAAAIALAWFYVRKRDPVHAVAAFPGPPKTVKIVEFTELHPNGPENSQVTPERRHTDIW